MFEHYNRAGEPISLAQWLWLLSGRDPEGGPDAVSPDVSMFTRSGSFTQHDAPAEASSDPSVTIEVASFNRALGADDPGVADTERADAYRRVAYDEVGPYSVSTVWLGINHGSTQHPQIFETLVGSSDEYNDAERSGLAAIELRRYATEADALAGHQETLTLIRAVQTDVGDASGVSDEEA